MKKSVILRRLTFVDASEIKLLIYLGDSPHPLEGIFTPIEAMRIIRNLPSKFSYGYIPIE